jgi:hypothetical protein
MAACRNDPQAVPQLVRALFLRDAKAAGIARKGLESLGDPRARNALIDLILEDRENDHLAPLIEEKGYRHSDEGRWYLLLLLTGRLEELFAEDVELRRLRKEFWAVPGNVRARLRASVLQSGDIRMNPLFVREKGDRPEADLTQQDADMLVKINVRNRNWESLFGFFWILPARHIAVILRAMADAGWSPQEPDRASLYARLAAVTKSKRFHGTDPHITMNPVFAEWFARGESPDFIEREERDLRTMLTESGNPPDQVAALAALRKRGRLTREDMAQAGRSPHWLTLLATASVEEPVVEPTGRDDRIPFWLKRIMPGLDARTLWDVKPGRVSRDDMEVLRRGVADLPDPALAGGLALVEAVASHYTAHDIEVDMDDPVFVNEDSFEIEG